MHVTLHMIRSARVRGEKTERGRERESGEEEENLSGLIQNSALWQF